MVFNLDTYLFRSQFSNVVVAVGGEGGGGGEVWQN